MFFVWQRADNRQISCPVFMLFAFNPMVGRDGDRMQRSNSDLASVPFGSALRWCNMNEHPEKLCRKLRRKRCPKSGRLTASCLVRQVCDRVSDGRDLAILIELLEQFSKVISDSV
jgi:hypothetical protein